MQLVKDFLFKPINSFRLAIFRIVIGFFATIESLYLYKVHFVEDYIVQPKVLFNYDFLPVSALPEAGMKALLLGREAQDVFSPETNLLGEEYTPFSKNELISELNQH